MAVLWSIFVPAVVFAHVLGGVLLLYSLEKVSGVVSKSWKRVFGRFRSSAKTEDADQLRESSETTPTGGPTEELETAAHKARAVNAWRRGCNCEVIHFGSCGPDAASPGPVPGATCAG